MRTIGADGVQGLTLRQVGDRLGVSRTALYRHFSDKSTLLAAVAADGFLRFRDDLRHAWQSAEGTWTGFERMGAAYVHFAVAHPAHYRVMFGDYRAHCARNPDLQTDAASAFGVLVAALASLQQAGVSRADETTLLAGFIWATMHGIAMLAIDGQLGPEPDSSGRLDALLKLGVSRMRSGIELEPAR